MSSSEVAISLPNILIFLGCLVHDLHIAGEISFPVHFAKSICGFVRNICVNKFVVT